MVDKGVQFIHDNFKKVLELCDRPEYNHLKSKVIFEFNSFNKLTRTSDVYNFFLKYKDGNHKNASDFEFLEKYGLLSSEKIADFLMANYPEEIGEAFSVDKLKVNEAYNNNDLFLLFNDFISGIRSNREKKIIGCVFNHEGLYEDKWIDDNTLLYTGEGKKGDQTPTSSGNKDLITAANNRNEWHVYLFEKIEKNKYYYRGEVYVDPTIKSKSNVLDDDYNPRTVLQFLLTLKEPNLTYSYSEDDVIIIEKAQKKKVDELKPEILHELVKNKTNQVTKKYSYVKQYNRDQAISKYTKIRSNGRCDLCGEQAPFNTKEGPYLESHHVITLAEGGPDVIYNTVALCPNCHRKIHNLKDQKDIKQLTRVIYNYLIEDNDLDNIINWKELFHE